MKFTDLTSAQRSMLTMLCTGQAFNTAELGRGCNPTFRPDQAASSLLRLRDLGLVYSNQKPAGQQHAMWEASEYGRGVFSGRPEDVPLEKEVQVEPVSTPTGPSVWIVYKTPSEGTVGSILGSYSSEELALDCAKKRHMNYGGEYNVAKIVARVKPVQKPTFEIERV